jgi:hypothetical protein
MRTILICLVLSACSKPATPPPSDVTAEQPKIVAKPVEPKQPTTQEEARVRAKDVELPKLRTADRAVIKWVRDGGEAERKGEDLIELVAALTIDESMPSGGIMAAEIQFYKAGELVGEVWAYGYGEWGIKRTNATSWTMGRSEQLAALLKK